GELAREFADLTPDELTRMERALADFDRIMAGLDRGGRRPIAPRHTSATEDEQETSMSERQAESLDTGAPAAVDDERFVLELFGTDARATAYDRYAEMRARGPVVPVHLEGIFPAETEEELDDAKRDDLARLRAARGFVSDVYMVTTHDTGMAALLDDRFSVDPRSTMTPEELAAFDETPREFRPLSRSLLTVDPPDHNRLRALVQPSFTGRRMEALRPRIRALAEGFLDRAEAAAAERGETAPNRRIELISQFAYPLPVTVISDMLGIPEEDRARAQVWSENLIQGRFRQGDADARQGLLDFIDYLNELFERKRREPSDDMITSLVQAEEAGDKLDEDELLSMVFIVYVAGHVTTVNLIGNGVYALLTHPDQLAKVVADPAGTAKGLVEEVLRFHGPAEGVFQRIATEDVALAGTTIARGERIMVSLASADRDPARFANPDVFDIERPDANRHIGFGKGIHACLGAPLARVEGQVAFQLLFERYPDMRLAVPASEIHWNGGFLRGLESLPILV
ncbi:MAG TPA: cytochrome P450, partial [Thermomicrobiales bacterium]|nr:cytochrome P450 [Thermomicrobiales bacterium]